MPLPDSRNHSYVTGDLLAAQDMDDIQDCIVGGKHGSISTYQSLRGFLDVAGTWTLAAGEDGKETLTPDAADRKVSFAVGGIDVGDTVEEIGIYFTQAGSETMIATVYRYNGGDDTVTVLGTPSSSDPGAQLLKFDVNEVAGAAYRYMVEAHNSAGTNAVIRAVHLKKKRA